MLGRRALLPSAMFTLVLIATLTAATRTTYADECLAKPNAPTPTGQHWYYRIDHANNNRQCWRLAPEGLPIQKTISQPEDVTASGPDTRQLPRTPQTVATAPARASADAIPAAPADPTAATSLVPWPATPKVPALLPVLPQTEAVSQTASADNTVPVTASTDTSAAKDDKSPTGGVQAERSKSPATERSSPSAAPPQQSAGIDHTFALLMVMFALLAVTGPILHFTHRQRQNEVISYKPPRWAPVVPLNTPAPLIRRSQALAPAPRIDRPPVPQPVRLTQTPDSAVRRPAPDRPEPADPNERLRRALQQLVDRIQTIQPIQPSTVSRRTLRADVEVLKNAR